MRKFSAFLLVSVLLFICCAPACAGFSSDPDALEAAAKSVLMLEIYDDDYNLIATGSGFIAFNEYTLVTNYHVIEDAASILAISDDGYSNIVTDIIVADEQKDLAILELVSTVDLTPLTLGTGENLKRGSSVAAIGSPNGITNSVSTGIISALYEYENVSWIQFTAPISEGSSGGALFDDDGNVIGVTSASYVDTQNMNMAINIAEVIALYNNRGSDSTPYATQAPKSATEDDSLIRFFDGMEDITTGDEAVAMFKSFGFKDAVVYSEDDSNLTIAVDGEGVTYYGIALDVVSWIRYFSAYYDYISETLYPTDSTEYDFEDARDKLIDVYGTPDFGYIELFEDGYSEWDSNKSGHHEICYLTEDEMLYYSIEELRSTRRLTDCDYDVWLYWNNLSLYYGLNDGQYYFWLTTTNNTYEDIMRWYPEIWE